ncbi:MAG: DUF6348 family protein [Planctomycetota bacterium]
MRHSLILLVIVAIGCGQSPPPPAPLIPANEPIPQSVEFFSQWLKDHGHSDVVTDEQGVGIANNATRLSASIYGANPSKDGGFVVETEFRIQLPSGRVIVEFVAGIGDSKENAITDSLVNFVLTTFHVVYKGFINFEDPHLASTKMTIAGKEREVLLGNIFLRSNSSEERIDLSGIRPQIEAMLEKSNLSSEVHWIKIVYAQMDGKPMTVSVSTDNAENQSLTEQVTRLDWPSVPVFYMSKQFIVVK